MAIEVRKFDAPLGAEILGVDCSGDLEDAVIAQIERAWHDNLVLVMRGQNLDNMRLMVFTRRFGELDMAPPNPSGRPYIPEHPEINVVTNIKRNGKLIGSHGNAEMSWHSDLDYDPVPPTASLLYGIHCPPEGGATCFANMYLAYETLPEEVKEKIRGRKAIHDISTNAVGVLRAGYDKVTDPRKAPGCHHPLVRVHPKTGRKALFVNEIFTSRIVGLAPAESRALLDLLFVHIRGPRFHCRFRWRSNSVAFWDNRCAQHLALWDYFPQTRSGHRFTIVGDKPV